MLEIGNTSINKLEVLSNIDTLKLSLEILKLFSMYFKPRNRHQHHIQPGKQ